MTLQWYPGHMMEARKALRKAAAGSGAIVEVLDARFPLSSANPFVDTLCRNRFRLRLLNKSDLADPQKTAMWISRFAKHHKQPAAAVCALHKKQVQKSLFNGISGIRRNRAKTLKIMVVGIPNTGKSTLINTLAGRKTAKTGDAPAVTRQQQRVCLRNNVDIYDTPGILWPVIEPEQRALVLAAGGAIPDGVADPVRVALFAAQFLIQNYAGLIMKRYPFLKEVPTEPGRLIDAIGRKRGCLKKGGDLDTRKASEILIRELRKGRIGLVSFETPKNPAQL